MFCPKCGTKAVDGAAFCQKCGSKLIVEASNASTPEQKVPPKPSYAATKQPTDKKSKMPVILGITAILFLLFIFRGVIDSHRDSENEKVSKSSANVTDVNLSQSYSNDKEGISFQYPSDWVPLSRKEIVSRVGYEEADDFLAVIVNENETPDKPEDDFCICLLKIPAAHDDIDLIFGDDGQFEKEYIARNNSNISAVNTSITTLDGVTAREIQYVDSEGYGYQRYYYAVGTTIYCVDFSWQEEIAGDKQRVFDAIIDSYTITADTAYTDKPETVISSKATDGLCFRGIPVDQLFGASKSDIISLLGEPDPSMFEDELIYGDSNMSFDSWSLPEPYLMQIYGWTFEDYTYNGRPFTTDGQKIIEIMGREPDSTEVAYPGQEFGTYFINYEWDCLGSTVNICFSLPADEYSTMPPGISVGWWHPDAVPLDDGPGDDYYEYY